jgi:hypothetical protein
MKITITLYVSFIVFSQALLASQYHPQLINGNLVPAGQFTEVISLSSGSNGCTATVIGPQTIVTAGHCTTTGAVITFTINSVTYNATMTKSPTAGLDLALGLTDKPLPSGITPASIGGTASSGLTITLLGYGCTDPTTNTFDNLLRMGTTVITQVSSLTVTSNQQNGAGICFGDPGGPAEIIDSNNNHLVIGVNSQGNLKDTNIDARTDVAEAASFFQSFIAANNNAQICGVNQNCGTGPTAPSCTLTANPTSVQLGNTVTFTLAVQGQVTTATIDGTPVQAPGWNKVYTPTEAGSFSSVGTVTNAAGSQGTCSANYTVINNPTPAPTCTLTANPTDIQLGQSLTISMTTTGQTTSATIDGQTVSLPSGSVSETPPASGMHQSIGVVNGPGGTSNCQVNYSVEPVTPGPVGPTIDYAVVPTYCGNNTLTQTSVQKVCLGVVSQSHGSAIVQVVIVTYNDSTQEVLPVINSVDRPKDPNDLRTISDINLYTNAVLDNGTSLSLATKAAILTQLAATSGGTPAPESLEGNTAKGIAFLVNLSPFSAVIASEAKQSH